MIPPYLADTRVAKLTFFPEGGNLIEGIPAKVAFKALNEKGIYYNRQNEKYEFSKRKVRKRDV